MAVSPLNTLWDLHSELCSAFTRSGTQARLRFHAKPSEALDAASCPYPLSAIQMDHRSLPAYLIRSSQRHVRRYSVIRIWALEWSPRLGEDESDGGGW